MQKAEQIYRGKAKTVYLTSDPNYVILEFRDDTSAFDGQRIEQLSRKGATNNKFNHFVMTKLEEAGIPTQIEALLSNNETLVKKLTMIPVECVIRNRAAGTLVRRLGRKEGEILCPPIFELFLKNDVLHDPMLTESHCITFGFATSAQIQEMKELSVKVNTIMSDIFDKAGFILIDFKLEFGLFNGQIVLGDEFSPDGCRIWEKESLKKMDKDRFRQQLGNVIEAYEEVARRIGVAL